MDADVAFGAVGFMFCLFPPGEAIAAAGFGACAARIGLSAVEAAVAATADAAIADSISSATAGFALGPVTTGAPGASGFGD